MVLKEQALFQTSAIPVFQKIWRLENSGESDWLSSLTDKEKQTFDDSITSLENRSAIESNAVWKDKEFQRLIVEYAAKGNDTKTNPGLYYLVNVTDNMWQHKSYVLDILTQIKDNKIVPLDNQGIIQSYLLNESLYTRGQQEFSYSVYAFNLFHDDKEVKKYFPHIRSVAGKKYILMNLDENEFKELFDDAALKNGEDWNAAENYVIEEGSVQGYIEFSDRFFFDGKQVSTESGIIPAGINSTSGRNIWHYIDLYSNPMEESIELKDNEPKKQEPTQQQNDNRSKIDQLKDLIGSSKMNSRTRQQIFSLLNDLL